MLKTQNTVRDNTPQGEIIVNQYKKRIKLTSILNQMRIDLDLMYKYETSQPEKAAKYIERYNRNKEALDCFAPIQPEGRRLVLTIKT